MEEYHEKTLQQPLSITLSRFFRISIFREEVVGTVWPHLVIPAMCKMCFFVISRPFMREMASYLLVTSQIVASYGG